MTMTANVMRERKDFPRYGTWVHLVHYNEGNPLRGDQSEPDIEVIGRVTETPHPGFGSNYLAVAPADGAVFDLTYGARGEQFTITPRLITLGVPHAATEWTWEQTAEPTTRLAVPPPADATAVSLDSLPDATRVRAQAASILMRYAKDAASVGDTQRALGLLDVASTALASITSGVTGPELRLARQFVHEAELRLAHPH